MDMDLLLALAEEAEEEWPATSGRLGPAPASSQQASTLHKTSTSTQPALARTVSAAPVAPLAPATTAPPPGQLGVLRANPALDDLPLDSRWAAYPYSPGHLTPMTREERGFREGTCAHTLPLESALPCSLHHLLLRCVSCVALPAGSYIAPMRTLPTQQPSQRPGQSHAAGGKRGILDGYVCSVSRYRVRPPASFCAFMSSSLSETQGAAGANVSGFMAGIR